jgi:hypothetical protein
LITTANGANGGYKRYLITQSGISPRAIPSVPGHTHTVATDEHDEEGVLIMPNQGVDPDARDRGISRTEWQPLRPSRGNSKSPITKVRLIPTGVPAAATLAFTLIASSSTFSSGRQAALHTLF